MGQDRRAVWFPVLLVLAGASPAHTAEKQGIGLTAVCQSLAYTMLDLVFHIFIFFFSKRIMKRVSKCFKIF